MYNIIYKFSDLTGIDYSEGVRLSLLEILQFVMGLSTLISWWVGQ